MIAQAQAVAEVASPGSFETAWKIGGPWAVVSLALVGALIYFVRLYIAEVQARIADARAYGKTQEDINMVLLPTMARIVKRMQELEGKGDSDRPPALAVRESLIALGEDTSSKGPSK